MNGVDDASTTLASGRTGAVAHYCTYFDDGYLSRGIALHASMRRHCRPFRLWVLCLTQSCYELLSRLELPDTIPLRLDDLEKHDRALAAVRRNRSTIEYYFTITPALMTWLLEIHPEIDVLTYLDSDLFFFHSPDFLIDEFTGYSCLIVPHRFSRRNDALKKFGIYNVGWISFRRDSDGLACLGWWRQSCIEWCRDFVEENRFADQKYLDHFPERFGRVQIAQHPGVNLAPWNLDNYTLSLSHDNVPEVDNVPVIFFHFHALRPIAPFLWHTSHARYGAPLDRHVRSWIYAPYLRELNSAARLVRSAATISATRREHPLIRMTRPLARLRETTKGGWVWLVMGRVL
jgi:hypothetical protein